MIAVWCIVGLIIATVSVSTLGAAFSVLGLSALFSGAALAVCAMAIALEFAKFVLSAYLHQRWQRLNFLFKSYLLFAIVVLSIITSMGIFGFLSDAYQSASGALDAENIKLAALQSQQNRHVAEINRINKGVDEIPANQSTKRFKARAQVEPLIAAINNDTRKVEEAITASNLRILEVKQRVGPLIYISRTFKLEIDDVVKYLILILVFVFDPLAICLVIATSDALLSRKEDPLSLVKPINKNKSAPPLEPIPSDVIQMSFVDHKDKNVV